MDVNLMDDFLSILNTFILNSFDPRVFFFCFFKLCIAGRGPLRPIISLTLLPVFCHK